MERRLPGRRHTEVGIAVVVPVVVDVETLGVEIADVHAVAVRVQIFVRSRLCPLWHRSLRFTAGCANAYILSLLYLIREQLFKAPPREANKKFNLHP